MLLCSCHALHVGGAFRLCSCVWIHRIWCRLSAQRLRYIFISCYIYMLSMLYVFSTFSASLFFGDSSAMPWYITTFLSVKICIDKKGMIREKCWYIWGAWEIVTKNWKSKKLKKARQDIEILAFSYKYCTFCLLLHNRPCNLMSKRLHHSTRKMGAYFTSWRHPPTQKTPLVVLPHPHFHLPTRQQFHPKPIRHSVGNLLDIPTFLLSNLCSP